MFEVGEYLVHPGQGVCKVADITEDENPMYKLLPIGLRHPMLITYPVSSSDRLRPVVEKDEAKELIEGYQDMKLDSHKARSRALEEKHYRSVIKNGSCRDTVRVVKTFRKRIEDVKAEDKKPPVVYRRIFREARDRSLEELAVALETTPDEVEAIFIQQTEDFTDVEEEAEV